VKNDVIKHSLDKAIIASLFCAVIYLSFGALSWKTISAFKPELSIIDNTWPRLILVSLPFCGLYWFLKNSKKSFEFKLSIWCLSFAVINAVSACIYVWPIALKNPEIILHFSSVNNLIFVVSGIYMTFPNRIFHLYFISWSLFFFGPIMWLTHANDLLFSTILQDITLYSATLYFLRGVINRVFQKPIEEKYEHIQKSSLFLDESINEAFENGVDLTTLSGRRSLFVFQVDVRGYTDFLNKNDDNDELLRSFSIDLNKLVRGTIKKYKGKTHKTAGDGYLCFFMEPSSTNAEAQIDDIYEATEKFRTSQLTLIVRAFHEISDGFHKILRQHNLEDMQVCAGVHFGDALFEFFGFENRQEYDVVSRNLAYASRLEEYTKRLQISYGANDYLVISEVAYQYFDEKLANRMPIAHAFTGENGDCLRSFKEVKRIYFLTSENEKSGSIGNQAQWQSAS
jgi:class 3 adenylate cyclase